MLPILRTHRLIPTSIRSSTRSSAAFQHRQLFTAHLPATIQKTTLTSSLKFQTYPSSSAALMSSTRSLTQRATNAAPDSNSEQASSPISKNDSQADDDENEIINGDSRYWWIVAGLSGTVAVTLASFGAHGLKKHVTDTYYLDIWKTGTDYQIIHALALCAAPVIVGSMRKYRARTGQTVLQAFQSSFLGRKVPASSAAAAKRLTPYPNWAARCLFGGTVLFSGSLYAITLTENRKFGMIAPFGGVGLLLGWLFLAFGI